MPYTLEVRRNIPLSVEKTFAILSDHNQLGGVIGLPCRRTRDGEGDVNGLGSVRTLGVRPLDFDETITAFEPNQRIEYRITRGTPLRKHVGTVRFSPAGSGCDVSWHIQYEMSLPVLGGVIREVLRLGLKRGLGKLGR